MTWHQYAAAWAEFNGGYDLRRAPASVRGWLRAGYAVARALASLRVPVGALFGLAMVLAVAFPATVAGGPLGLVSAAVLVVLSAFVLTLDGALTVLRAGDPARAAIRAGLAGRLAELSWLAGFWLVGVPAPLVVVCGAVTLLYESARQEALAGGMSQIGVQTVADRPTRVWIAGVGSLLAGLVELVGVPIAAGLLAVATTGWLALALIGATQLTTAVRRALS